MELIFYPEAANITGATVGSVAHAVSRGDLTRAGRKGRNLCLIKEQVELFRNRKISRALLSPAHRAKWDYYAQEASKLTGASTTIDEESINRMIEQKVRAQFLQQEAARLRREEQAAREKRERLEEENPFLMAV